MRDKYNYSTLVCLPVACVSELVLAGETNLSPAILGKKGRRTKDDSYAHDESLCYDIMTIESCW